MAEIVQEAPPAESGSILQESFQLMMHYWWVLFLIAIIVAAFIALILIWRSKEENDRRRDSAVYATALNLRTSCELNKKDKWIRTRYSLWNLLWFGIPFIMREHSVKLVDVDRNVLGWYRGHTKTQDGDDVFLFYKTKSFLGLFEDKLLMYCLKRYRVPRMKENTKTKQMEAERDPTTGAVIFDYQELPADVITYDANAREIVIKANTITKQGNYYHCPNYVLIGKDGQKHIDLTYDLSNFVSKVNFVVSLENAYADMSRGMGRASELNPWLKFEQKAPDKEKVIDDGQKPPV